MFLIQIHYDLLKLVISDDSEWTLKVISTSGDQYLENAIGYALKKLQRLDVDI